MKITLPEHIGEITLDQYQKYHKLIERDLSDYDFSIRKITIFTPLNLQQVKGLRQVDYESIVKQIDIALNTEVKFVQTFHLNGKEYGFIPNLDKITIGEFTDLSKYNTDIDTLHNLMAILFRQIINKDAFGNYEIESYKGTEGKAELMKQVPLHIVNGALFFFANLLNELESYTLKYLNQVQVKANRPANTLKSGDGMRLSMN